MPWIPHPIWGKAAIHLGRLTVNLFLQLLRKHSRGTNNLQICTEALSVWAFVLKGYLCILKLYTLRSDSLDGWGLIRLKSQGGLDVMMLQVHNGVYIPAKCDFSLLLRTLVEYNRIF